MDQGQDGKEGETKILICSAMIFSVYVYLFVTFNINEISVAFYILY